MTFTVRETILQIREKMVYFRLKKKYCLRPWEGFTEQPDN